MKKRRNKFRKITSYILLFSMLLNGMIFDVPISYGESGEDDKPTVRITTKYDDDFEKIEKRIRISDSQIGSFREEDMVIKILEYSGGIRALPNIRRAGSNVEADFDDPEWVIESAIIEGYNYAGEKVDDIEYSKIDEKGIPQILDTESFSVKVGEPIILNMSTENLGELIGDKYTVQVNGKDAEVEKVEGESDQIQLIGFEGGESFEIGTANISIILDEDKNENENEKKYNLETVSLYENVVNITGELNIDGVTMFPTMGEPDSRVTFTRDTFPSNEYDIYFIKDRNVPEFTEENRAKNFNMANNDDEDDVITVEVPNLGSGPYYVVFTNANSQDQGVSRTYRLDQQYQVVTISQKPRIRSIQPNEASAGTPTEVTINGNFFVNHNVPGFKPSGEIEEITTTSNQVVIDYGKGELSLDNEEGGSDVYDVEVTREIKVDIGRVLDLTGEGFECDLGNENDPNTFIVLTEPIDIEEIKTEDVIISVNTIIEGADFNLVMEQEVIREDGFTYYPETESPEVYEVVPDIIPIEKIEESYYIDSSMDSILLSIEGDNFLVTRYEEDGEEKINYPKVTLGGTVINPNETQGIEDCEPLKFEVLNNEQVVDGTPENEIGDRILIELETGSEGFDITSINNESIYIQNPIRQSERFDNVDWEFPYMIEFREIDENDFPIINNVRPSLVSMDGGDEVVISGSNFRPGAEVYIDNNLVPDVEISGENSRIIFNAPPGTRPGETLLQVVNPEGGIATHVFTYTETYTQPSLDYINPKEGTTNTLVTVKGENFLSPDPTVVINDINQVDEYLIYRLIGTRIFIDGHDINEYNRGDQNRIELEEYENEDEEIFQYNEGEGKVVLGEGYDSVVLYDATNNKFYSIRRDVHNNYFIEGGGGIRYDISYNKDENKFYADDYEITMEDGVLKFNELTLKALTPFKIEDGKIIGNRVRFTDSNTLTFRVPNLANSPWTSEGYYDVSIVNPDTKTETIEDGFYFFASSSTRPVIEDIVPDRGPEQGGNIIRILGPEIDSDDRIGFMDTGEEQTQVFIGGQEVPAEDVTILPGGRVMEVKAPPTIENIKDKGTDRITVSIVLVNPDGGTFSISYENPLEVDDKTIRGYTYLVPTSNPRITSISPIEGSAAGGYILEIFGSDFRDFEPFVDTVGNGEYDEDEDMPYDDIDGSGDYTEKAPRTTETSKYNPEYEYLTSPLFPTVYFGNKEAEIVNFGTGYLQVIVPPNEAGTVDLYVVNNDSGISNKVNYNYLSSNPAINDIVPSVGHIRGGTKIGIYGSNLENNTLMLVEDNGSEELSKKTEHMPLVRFGNNTNENLPREHENSGVIRSNRATVNLDGEIEIRYNAANGELNATLEENDTKYTFTYEDYNGDEVFINTKDFKYEDENYPYEQLIRLEVDNNRLNVSANFAPKSEYNNNTQITATTPVYFKAGTTPVFVINPDKGQAEWEFEFKYPDSNPEITDVTKEGGEGPVLEYRDEIDGEAEVLRVDHRGGNRVTIHGADFREGSTIKIEDLLTITESDIEYDLPNQLTFTMPSVPEGEAGFLNKIIVENTDGGTADSSTNSPPIYVEFIVGESNPEIYTIEPTEGSATGGTKVRITGMDFREEMEKYPNGELEVYFGDEKVDHRDINYIDYRTIEVTAPESTTLGPVQVRVENPDGSITRDEIYFNYISKPTIETVSPNNIFTNDTETEVTLTGDMFMPGATVVVGGEIVGINNVEEDMDVKGEGILGVDSEGNNVEVAVVGGMEAASVTVEGDNVIKVQFQEAEGLENNDLIIINPDGGISDPYDEFDYQVPVPTKPLVLEGIPGYESTVQLIWSKSDEDILNKATRYEIYGKLEKDENHTFIGDTTEAQFLVRGLEPNTEYEFMVRALNEHGAAIEFATVEVKTLTIREDEKLREKEDNLNEEEKKIAKEGKEEIVGDRVIKTVGSDIMRRGEVDFTLSKYKNYDSFTVSVPIEYARGANTLNIKDGTMTTIVNTKDLYTLEVSKNDNGDKDAYVNINFDRSSEYYLPRGKRQASKAYSVSFDYQYGKNRLDIDNLVRPARLTLKQDKLTYPSITDASLYRFNKPTGEYVEVGSTHANIRISGKYILLR